MKRILTILFLFLSVASFSQTYQAMPQAGYGPVKRMLFDSVLTIPIGIPDLRNIIGGRDVGQIRYVTSDSSIYVYTGTNWIKASSSGGGPSTPDTIVAKYPIRIDTTGVKDTIYLAQSFVDSVYNGSLGFGTGLISAGILPTDTVVNITPPIVWKRNGTLITQNAGQAFPITRASPSYYRTDLIYITVADTLSYIQGVESLANPAAPIVPVDGIVITYVNVFDSTSVSAYGPPSTYQRTAVVYVDANTGSLATDSVSFNWNQTNKALAINSITSNTDTATSIVTGRDVKINNIRIGKGRTYVNNYIMTQGGFDAPTTANFNTGIGDSVLRNLTTGIGNMAIGYRSLYSATINSNNVAIGNSVLANATTSTAVFLGDIANGSDTLNVTSMISGTIQLYQSITGTGVGPSGGSQWIDGFITGSGGVGTYRLLRIQTSPSITNATITATSTASSNTGVGWSSMFANTTGYNNTSLGRTALQNNTVGINNTAIGMSALFSNTTGRENAAVGYWSLLNNTTGRENIAFGTTALRNNTIGSRNVGLGREALWTATSSNNNTGVGYRAGYANSGDSCVFIGSEAGFNNTQKNKLYIANTATATPLIYGEFDSARLTINGRLNITGPLSNASEAADSALIISTAGQVKKAALGGGGGGGGTVTSVAALTLGTSGTDLNSTVANSTTTPVITLNVPNASATARGVVTTGTQTFAGAKTFSSNLTVNGATVGTNAQNTIVGSSALSSLSSGNYNVALGFASGLFLSSGGNNTFLGAQAGTNRVSGNNNTSIGYNANSGVSISNTGDDNTVVGSQGIVNLTSGSRNTMIGFNNLDVCGSGSNNTIVGARVLPATTTLSNNVILADGQGNIRFRNTSTATYLDGSVAIGISPAGTTPTAPAASAALDITSTTQGFLPPRMTGAQAELISSPAEGLMVYSTDGSGTTITSKGWWGYDGTTWVKLN